MNVPQINFHPIDCMEFMRGLPDKAYDLAIVDPPYYNDAASTIRPGAAISTSGVKRSRNYNTQGWSVPTNKYFQELFRASKNQIIWGINYLEITPPGWGRVVWDKRNDNGQMRFSNCEIAYCSQINRVVIYRYTWDGMRQENMQKKEVRIHPTQKPVALYKWLLSQYAKPGWKILDTHGGSCSIAIACYDDGFDLDVCEIDPDYFKAAKARFDAHTRQQTFNFPQPGELFGGING